MQPSHIIRISPLVLALLVGCLFFWQSTYWESWEQRWAKWLMENFAHYHGPSQVELVQVKESDIRQWGPPPWDSQHLLKLLQVMTEHYEARGVALAFHSQFWREDQADAIREFIQSHPSILPGFELLDQQGLHQWTPELQHSLTNQPPLAPLAEKLVPLLNRQPLPLNQFNQTLNRYLSMEEMARHQHLLAQLSWVHPVVRNGSHSALIDFSHLEASRLRQPEASNPQLLHSRAWAVVNNQWLATQNRIATGFFSPILANSDNALVKAPLVLEMGGDLYPSLALRLIQRLHENAPIKAQFKDNTLRGLRIQNHRISTLPDGLVYICPALGSHQVESTSFNQVMSAELPKRTFEGKLVVVGIEAAGFSAYQGVYAKGINNEAAQLAMITHTLLDHLYLGRSQTYRQNAILVLFAVALAFAYLQGRLSYYHCCLAYLLGVVLTLAGFGIVLAQGFYQPGTILVLSFLILSWLVFDFTKFHFFLVPRQNKLMDQTHEQSQRLEQAYELMTQQSSQLKDSNRLLELKNQQLLNRAKAVQVDLRLAAKVQKNLFLKIEPPPYLAIHMRFEPLTEVSGDIYHHNYSQEGTFDFFLGDATGHGVAAAFITIMAKMSLMNASPEQPTHLILEMLNEALVKYSPEDHFMSGVYVRVRADGLLRVAKAGHIPPIVIPADGSAPVFLDPGGIYLGTFAKPPLPFSEHTYMLKLQDKVVLLTDGCYERFNSNQEMFGLRRLIDLLLEGRELESGDHLNWVFQQLDVFSEGMPSTDDSTLIIMQYQEPSRLETSLEPQAN